MLLQRLKEDLGPAELASLHTYTYSLPFARGPFPQPFLAHQSPSHHRPFALSLPSAWTISLISLPSQLLPDPNGPSLGRILFPGGLHGTGPFSLLSSESVINVNLPFLLEGSKWVCSLLYSQRCLAHRRAGDKYIRSR